MSFLANFHYSLTGPENPSVDQPKLVFLHGVMGFAANWRRIAKAFEEDYQILTYDQRGHGRSFQPVDAYTPDDYAGDLTAILQELGWSKITLVGHSMGGRVALHFAARAPEVLTRLVIEDIGPQMEPEAQSLILRLLDATPVPFASKRAAKEWFDNDFMTIFKDEKHKEGLAAFLYANLIENENKEAVWRFSEPGIRQTVHEGREHDRWDEVTGLTMPTLVVRGQNSHDLPRSVYEKMLTLNPLVQGVEIPDAGHWVHSDQPDLFIQALERFFRSN